MDLSQSSIDVDMNPGDPSSQTLQEITPVMVPRYTRITGTPFMDNCMAVLSKNTEAEERERAARARKYQDLFRSLYMLSAPAPKDATTKSHEERRSNPSGRNRNPTMGSSVPDFANEAPNPGGEYHKQEHAITIKQEDALSFTIYEDTSELGYDLPVRHVTTPNQTHSADEDTQNKDTDIEMPDSCADIDHLLGSDSTMSVEDLRI